MVNRLLVTTALEETWDTKKPMLFLGEWCKLYNRKKYWEWLKQLNFNLLPSSLEITSKFNRNFTNQKFRQVYIEGVDNSAQIPFPDLQLRNYLFLLAFMQNSFQHLTNLTNSC